MLLAQGTGVLLVPGRAPECVEHAAGPRAHLLAWMLAPLLHRLPQARRVDRPRQRARVAEFPSVGQLDCVDHELAHPPGLRIGTRHARQETQRLVSNVAAAEETRPGLEKVEHVTSRPEISEALPVPANHGLGANDVERVGPP